MEEEQQHALKQLPHSWKERVARAVHHPVLRWLMGLGIRLVVPKQRLGVAIVVLDDHGRVLMLRHVFHPDAPWGLPGGWLNRNEDPAEGALRELREETGLTAVIDRPVLVSLEPHPAHVGIAFLARPTSTTITLSGEILEADWFELDALPSPLFPIYERAIAAAVGVADQSAHQQKQIISSFEEITQTL